MKKPKDKSDNNQQSISRDVNLIVTASLDFEKSIKTLVNPIYEKLAPNEIFIISLQGDTLLYVVNRLGTAHLKQVTLE